MSVPLDRLYNYLQDVVNHDILIYRWNPHGSKKLEDLTLLVDADFSTGMDRPIMICHDQEPLDYNYYTLADVQKFYLTSPIYNTVPLELVTKLSKTVPLNVSAVIAHESLYDTIIITHSEVNGINLDLYKQNGFVPVYFWSHGVIARDWFRYAKTDPSLTRRTPKVPFLIYNRAWSGTREYRLKFADMLVKQGLHKFCRMGFNKIDGDQNYHLHDFKNSALRITSTDLEEYFFENQTSSTASADYCGPDYRETMLEVVLETLFDDDRWHLTEKSLRPIACGHPFILAATPGSLQYLRSYGFETFDGLIDETYDTIKDPVQRLHAIVQEMARLTTVDSNTWAQLRLIADKNKTRFFSKDFQEQIVNEFKENIHNAISSVKSGPVGANWSTIFEFAKTYLSDYAPLLQINKLDESTWATQWLSTHCP